MRLLSRHLVPAPRLIGALGLACLWACSDPPDPPPMPAPTDLPRWSTAVWVQWSGKTGWSERPGVVFVDRPGGPMDQIAADPDVTSFLNDRFQAWYIVPDAASPLLPARGVAFVDAAGCQLAEPFEPLSPAAFIAVGNRVLEERAKGATGRPWDKRDTLRDHLLPTWPLEHPLQLRCHL